LGATGALYGSGAYQQQLQQAQLNSGYQQQLQQAAYPFQTAQYLANITGGLAGAMGGTTTSQQQGTSTPAQPSIYSQILGAGTAGLGLAGGMGAFGSNPSYGGGNMFSGDAYGGSSANPAQGLNASDYGPGFAGGGNVPLDGSTPDITSGGGMNWMGSDPSVPNGQIHAAPINVPKITPLNMNSGSQSSSGPSLGDIAKTAISIGSMFAARGGAVPHFDDGGDVINPDAPYRMPDQPSVNKWRRGVDEDNAAGTTATPGLPSIIMQGANAPTSAMAFAPTGDGPPKENVGKIATGDDESPSPYADAVAAKNKKEMQNQSYQVPYDDTTNNESRTWAKSPWLALMNAGFGIMGGTSPYAGVNIGKGLQEGVKTLEGQRKSSQEEEAINQRARQLALQAQQHLDNYTRLKPSEAANIEKANSQLEQQGWQKGAENIINGDTTWFNPRTGESGVLKADGTWTPKGKTGAPPTGAAPPAGATPPVPPPPQVTPPVPPPPGGATPGAQSPVPPQQPPAGAQPPVPPQQPAVPPPVPPVQPPQEAPPPYGVKDLASNLEPSKSNITFMGKGSPLGKASDRDAQATIQAHVKSAQQEGALRQDIGNMKLAYATLTKDANQDKFLEQLAEQPGADFGARLEYAKKANALKIAAGEPPPFNPEKIAAAETINKIQNRMGLTFSSQISPREAFAGQKIGIESSPGLTNSPQGLRRLLATFEGLADQSRDERAFFQNYLQKNGTSLGWRQDFINKNPDERYVVKSIIGTLPPENQQHLAEDVEALRKDPSEKNKKLFNQHYADTASYFLNGKI
jgi:hypothetical protein